MKVEQKNNINTTDIRGAEKTKVLGLVLPALRMTLLELVIGDCKRRFRGG